MSGPLSLWFLHGPTCIPTNRNTYTSLLLYSHIPEWARIFCSILSSTSASVETIKHSGPQVPTIIYWYQHTERMKFDHVRIDMKCTHRGHESFHQRNGIKNPFFCTTRRTDAKCVPFGLATGKLWAQLWAALTRYGSHMVRHVFLRVVIHTRHSPCIHILSNGPESSVKSCRQNRQAWKRSNTQDLRCQQSYNDIKIPNAWNLIMFA